MRNDNIQGTHNVQFSKDGAQMRPTNPLELVLEELNID